MSAEHRDDIQGLRGLAVILVVAYHAGVPFLTGGYVGVDVFFVISGYVICGLLLRELRRSGAIDLKAFYARRMRRLLPAVTVVTGATLLAGLVLGSPLEFATHAASALATSLYASNLRFAVTATDYLADSAETDPFLHTWSLGVEEQFYFVWPLMLLLLYRMAPERHRSLFVATGFAVLGAVSLLASDYLTAYNQPWGFFSPWTRAFEFALGGIGYCLTSAFKPRSRVAAIGLMFAGLAAVLYATFMFDERTRFPGTAALVPAIGTFALLLGPAIGPAGIIDRALRTGFMKLCGDLSYSWYLWHWPVLVYARVLFPDLTLLGGIICAVSSFALAWVTLVTVENPIRTGRRWPLPPSRSIAAGLAATAGNALCAGAVIWVASRALSTPEQIAFRQAHDDFPISHGNGCHLRFIDTVQPECRYGTENGQRTIVLFGDSHAGHWFPAFEDLAARHHWTILPWTKSACPSFSVTTFLTDLGRTYHECEKWREEIQNTLRELRPDLVVLANASSYPHDSSANGVVPTEWWNGVERTLRFFDQEGIPVLVLGDTPWPGFDVLRCLSRAEWRGEDPNTACGFDPGAPEWLEDDVTADRVVQPFVHAAFIPTRQLICATSRCSPTHEGTVIYRDNSHMTAAFNRGLAEPLAKELGKHFPSLFDGE